MEPFKVALELDIIMWSLGPHVLGPYFVPLNNVSMVFMQPIGYLLALLPAILQKTCSSIINYATSQLNGHEQ